MRWYIGSDHQLTYVQLKTSNKRCGIIYCSSAGFSPALTGLNHYLYNIVMIYQLLQNIPPRPQKQHHHLCCHPLFALSLSRPFHLVSAPWRVPTRAWWKQSSVRTLPTTCSPLVPLATQRRRRNEMATVTTVYTQDVNSSFQRLHFVFISHSCHTSMCFFFFNLSSCRKSVPITEDYWKISF